MESNQKNQVLQIVGFFIMILIAIQPMFFIIIMIVLGVLSKTYFKDNKEFQEFLSNLFSSKKKSSNSNKLNLSQSNTDDVLSMMLAGHISQDILNTNTGLLVNQKSIPKIILNRKKSYLHIALNGSLSDSMDIAKGRQITDKILVEVGTPLIKIYGVEAIIKIKNSLPKGSYIIADSKCSDMASEEVEMMARAGASAITCIGVAPIETIRLFIQKCEEFQIDAMLDMMNVEYPLQVLKKLPKLPKVVILHRGVDETQISKFKLIPYYQIKQIKGAYNKVMIAVAGGDTIKEIQSSVFNGADIVTVWKDFYTKNKNTYSIIDKFMKEIK